MTQTPLKIDGINESLYAGFWLRLGSMLLDFIIVLPWAFLILYINNLGLYTYYFTFIPSILFSLWYNVYLVKTYGGTPGKLAVGIKIISISGESIDWQGAFLRHVVMLGITLFGVIIMFNSISIADESFYNSLSWLQKSQYLITLSPVLFNINRWISNIWIWGELIVLLTNKRKRAIHDYIASTVIIKYKYENAFRDFMKLDKTPTIQKSTPDIDNLESSPSSERTVQELVDNFESNSSLINKGIVNIWGDWTEKDNNNQISISNIQYESSVQILAISFNNGNKLTIWSPRIIHETTTYLKITKANKVLWEWGNNYSITYKRDGTNIVRQTNSSRDMDSQEVDPNKPAIVIIN